MKIFLVELEQRRFISIIGLLVVVFVRKGAAQTIDGKKQTKYYLMQRCIMIQFDQSVTYKLHYSALIAMSNVVL